MAKVFLSWSKQPSKRYADAFGWLIEMVLGSGIAWLSHEDIALGAVGDKELQDALKDCRFCLSFVTELNRREPWLNYEAGAFTARFETSRACPVLCHVKAEDVDKPLVSHQRVHIDDKPAILRLLKDIAKHLNLDLKAETLESRFKTYWSKFEKKLSEIKSKYTLPMTDIDRQAPLSWIEMDLISRRLGAQILSEWGEPDIMIGIGRGGAVLACQLCETFKTTPFIALDRVIKYDGKRTASLPHEHLLESEYAQRSIEGKKVLLVHGELNTAETTRVAYEAIERAKPKSIKIVCYDVRPKSPKQVMRPDYFGIESKVTLHKPWQDRSNDEIIGRHAGGALGA